MSENFNFNNYWVGRQPRAWFYFLGWEALTNASMSIRCMNQREVDVLWISYGP